MIINPGDIVFGEVMKSNRDVDIGIKIVERNGKLWIVGVRQDGLFRRFVPIKPGDQILRVNGRSAANASSIVSTGLDSKNIDRIFKEELYIKLKFRRAKKGEYGDYSPPLHSPL